MKEEKVNSCWKKSVRLENIQDRTDNLCLYKKKHSISSSSCFVTSVAMLKNKISCKS